MTNVDVIFGVKIKCAALYLTDAYFSLFFCNFSLEKCKIKKVVPVSFVGLLKATCAKLVGANVLTKKVVNAGLWNGMPAKFRARRDYAKKKVKKYIFVTCVGNYKLKI